MGAAGCSGVAVTAGAVLTEGVTAGSVSTFGGELFICGLVVVSGFSMGFFFGRHLGNQLLALFLIIEVLCGLVK